VIREAPSLGVTLGFLALSASVFAQATAADPDVLKGIAQVEDGEYDTAILTLDAAARRLSGQPEKVRDVSRAYLYLGIAYFAKGHEAAAKANFRDAIMQFGDISLNPEQYPPKIINLFEAARMEARQEAREVAAAAPSVAPEEKKGGSKMPLVLVAVAAAGGGAVALAGGGGGDDSAAAPAASPTPTPTVSFQQIASTDVPHEIPDVGEVTSSLGFTGTGSIVSVEVLVDIHHGRRGDLTLDLIHPDGTASRIFTGETDDAGENIAEIFNTANAPGLQTLEGRPSGGNWILSVNDRAEPHGGTLVAWALHIGGYF